MANWSQSHFLQSLGWAILNNFWQMALLWCFYLLLTHALPCSPARKYRIAVASVGTGFAWFLLTFLLFFTTEHETQWSFFNQTITQDSQWLQYFLLSASITYLGLLVFPSYRLLQNWKFVQRIKKEGLHKAELDYRLFVQKVAAQIGITKKVVIHVSELVTSPLTIGYLKPIILIPAAAFSHLSPQQVEAVLLHELSHIRRYDYLVNFLLSIIHTLLYFNPFVKNFVRVIETERETCCDELVLQFGYDKVSYASALLTLEKISVRPLALALAATGKSSLLHRIENIVGVERKNFFRKTQIAGMMAALFCVIAFNSVMIIKEKKSREGSLLAMDQLGNPFAFFGGDESIDKGNLRLPATKQNTTGEPKVWAKGPALNADTRHQYELLPPPPPPADEVMVDQDYMQVAADAVDGDLSVEEKATVAKAVSTTKKVISNLQWKEVENQIAEVLTEQEKVAAQKEMNQELEQINWKQVEQNLKAKYETLDWNHLNAKLEQAENLLTLDSLQQTYTAALSALSKAQREMEVKGKVRCSPLPDASVNDLKKAKLELKARVKEIRVLREGKKVIRL